MNNNRTHKHRKNHKIARAFMIHNISNKAKNKIEEDYNLGIKVETGTLSTVSEIIRAVSILDELVYFGKIKKYECVKLKMDLAQKMSGFKVLKDTKN